MISSRKVKNYSDKYAALNDLILEGRLDSDEATKLWSEIDAIFMKFKPSDFKEALSVVDILSHYSLLEAAEKNNELEKENKELKRIIRQAYLYVLDQNAEMCGGTKTRLTYQQEVQLGRDLATYGLKDSK